MNVLITGATGFLGSHLVNALSGKDTLTLLGRSEVKLANIKEEYKAFNNNYVCGDIKDSVFIDNTIRDYNIDLVIHCAALKRIDICQENPIEAYKVNVEGTKNIIDACKKYSTDLCFISTDKACDPSTTYGATKYLAEQLVRRESENTKRFKGYVIRYGNVLNSTGSVLTMWEKQYEEHGKVKVRDKDMTRFFWYIEDAVKFITSCLPKASYGDIFIPKIKSLNIYEMASHLYGEDIEITGMTHNEKIHEYMDGNTCSKDFVSKPSEILWHK